MSGITAFVLLGNSHLNEVSLCRRLFIEPWEGDKGVVRVRDLSNGQYVQRVEPDSPKHVIGQLASLIKGCIVAQPDDGATAADQWSGFIGYQAGTTLQSHVETVQTLDGVDVHVLQPSCLRAFGGLTGDWTTVDSTGECA